MADENELLTRLLSKFVKEMLKKLPRLEMSEIRRELKTLEARMDRLEGTLEKVSPELARARPGRRIKRVTLKERVVRLVHSSPDGIRTSQIARALGVAQTNVSHTLRQATEEGLIHKEKRGLYRPLI